MAKRLTTFPGGKPESRRQYPWQDWADGSVWEIRRGDDYDVSTENMRVNLHMKADSLLRKVRTQKVRDQQGEGLVFQFLESEDARRLREMAEQDPNAVHTAIERLYADALDIYERARSEVFIERKDGRQQRYAPVRYRQQIERGHSEGMLVPAVASIIRKRTAGFDHLEAAGRADLMLESLVLDTTKPYHHLFTPQTVEVARRRMDALESD